MPAWAVIKAGALNPSRTSLAGVLEGAAVVPFTYLTAPLQLDHCTMW